VDLRKNQYPFCEHICPLFNKKESICELKATFDRNHLHLVADKTFSQSCSGCQCGWKLEVGQQAFFAYDIALMYAM
jgi:hypothetical protein